MNTKTATKTNAFVNAVNFKSTTFTENQTLTKIFSQKHKFEWYFQLKCFLFSYVLDFIICANIWKIFGITK